MKIYGCLFCAAFLIFLETNAQFADSLQITIGSTVTAAIKSYQPLWITANRFGSVSGKKADASSHIQACNVHSFTAKKVVADSGQAKEPGFFIRYGVDLYNNNHFQKTFFQEGYLKAGYGNWEIRGGRYKEIVGEMDPGLSSGSFAVSGNAIPIPKIGMAVTNYSNVPYTKGWLQFKGRFSHGWFGNTNYVKRSYLHEKSLYIKLGRDRFNFYGGLNHFAQWGGTHPEGPIPGRFRDFLRIAVGASGDANDPVYRQGPIDITNAAGNHLLVSDYGFLLRTKTAIYTLYTQTIFERGKADSANQRDKLIGLNILSRDRLVGFSWASKNKLFLEKITIEGFYTLYQGGPVPFTGRTNYYNNSTFATGWEYQEQIIGTPLFINRKTAGYYHLDANTRWNIVSNRMKGLHLGFKGRITNKFSYRALAAYVQHYGNYYNDDGFSPCKKQGHLLYESSWQLTKAFVLTAALGKDLGNLSNNTGGSIKMEWNIKK